MFDFREKDPEFAERFEHFAFDEVVNEPGQQLDPITRHLAILATLLGCQGIDAFQEELPAALGEGVTPVMAKEVIYQAVDYLGIGRVMPFLLAANEILTDRGVSLPLEGQATTTLENRLEKGAQTQADIFGPHMLEAWKAGTHQPLAGGQLLRRLLHPHRPGPEAAGNDYLLLPGRSGRLRAPADRPRQGQPEPGQRQGLFEKGGFSMLALYRLSPQLKCHFLH